MRKRKRSYEEKLIEIDRLRLPNEDERAKYVIVVEFEWQGRRLRLLKPEDETRAVVLEYLTFDMMNQPSWRMHEPIPGEQRAFQMILSVVNSLKAEESAKQVFEKAKDNA